MRDVPETISPIICLSSGTAEESTDARKRMPHVLLVVDRLPKTLGGGETIVLRLAALLPRCGYRASILTFGVDPQSELQMTAAPCPVYLLALPKTYGTTACRGALALRRLLRQQDVQIVQTFFESSDLWAGLFTRLLSPAKLIWSRRDMGILRERKHDLAYRLLGRLPHAVFAVSEQVRQQVIESDKIAPERVHTIHNGLDLEDPESHPTSRPGGAVHVTTVGNIRRVKGHDLLVRAAAEVVVRHPEVTFTVAGQVLDPAYFEELQHLVRDLGLSGRFRFLGKVTDLRTHLQSADVFVLPSRSEGFSNALIEAMAAGLPVIATDVGGNAEAVQHRVSGLIVPPENAPAIAAAILQLLETPSMTDNLRAAGRKAVEEHFTADAMLRKTAAVYASLMGRA